MHIYKRNISESDSAAAAGVVVVVVVVTVAAVAVTAENIIKRHHDTIITKSTHTKGLVYILYNIEWEILEKRRA